MAVLKIYITTKANLHYEKPSEPDFTQQKNLLQKLNPINFTINRYNNYHLLRTPLTCQT